MSARYRMPDRPSGRDEIGVWADAESLDLIFGQRVTDQILTWFRALVGPVFHDRDEARAVARSMWELAGCPAGAFPPWLVNGDGLEGD